MPCDRTWAEQKTTLVPGYRVLIIAPLSSRSNIARHKRYTPCHGRSLGPFKRKRGVHLWLFWYDATELWSLKLPGPENHVLYPFLHTLLANNLKSFWISFMPSCRCPLPPNKVKQKGKHSVMQDDKVPLPLTGSGLTRDHWSTSQLLNYW